MLQLDRLTFPAYDNDFTLTINSHSCLLPSFVAELISPRISAARKSDVTLLSFFCTTHIPIPESDIHAFFAYLHGSSLPSSSDSIVVIGSALGVILDASSFSQKLTDENVVSVLHAKNLSHYDVTSEIEYVAHHFSSVENATSIDPDDLVQVLSSECLSIESEDWLLSFVSSYAQGVVAISGLLECVQCEYLSLESLDHYAALVDDLDPEDVCHLWYRIRGLFLKHRRPAANPRCVAEEQPFQFTLSRSGQVCTLMLLPSSKLGDVTGRLRVAFQIAESEDISFAAQGRFRDVSETLGSLQTSAVIVSVTNRTQTFDAEPVALWGPGGDDEPRPVQLRN